MSPLVRVVVVDHVECVKIEGKPLPLALKRRCAAVLPTGPRCSHPARFVFVLEKFGERWAWSNTTPTPVWPSVKSLLPVCRSHVNAARRRGELRVVTSKIVREVRS